MEAIDSILDPKVVDCSAGFGTRRLMNFPLARCAEPAASDLRSEARTHLFMVALLGAGAAAMPVRIRNLSASGALIEGANLPAAGAAVTIRRGGLSVEGALAWRSSNQAGVGFASNISVPAWLPKNGGSKQSAIDRLMFEAKSGPAGQSERPRPVCSLVDPNRALVELVSLRKELTILEDALVQDVRLVAAHPDIQLLDIALQRVDRLLSLAKEVGLALRHSCT